MKNLYIMLPEKIGTIDKNIYGQFAEHIGGVMYDGLWVGEDSPVPNIGGWRTEAVEKLRAIHVPVLRWPGGCFAETYHWRDGIGPREKRPTRLSWWGYEDGRTESNAVGTHEFVHLCRLIGAEPYFAVNITTMTPMDARDWMDYCNSPRGSTTLALEREKNGDPEPFGVRYWGVGNETWGGGGEMSAVNYAHEYRKYAAVLYDLTRYMGGELFVSGTNGLEADWARDCLGELRHLRYSKFNGYTLHYYCGGSECRGFDADGWYDTMRKVQRTQTVIDRTWGFIMGYGMEKEAKLVFDEWGTWHKPGSGPSKGANLYEQQSTMREALVAGNTLNIFQNNCDKIRMANIAQVVNNLQSLMLAAGDRCITTPTYHVFDLYQGHMDATAVRTAIDNDEIAYINPKDGQEAKILRFSASASVKEGKVTVTLTNADLQNGAEIALHIVGGTTKGAATVRVLHCDNPDTVNTFEAPDQVTPAPTAEVTPEKVVLPPACVATIEIPLA